jgi:hypothetical protein
MVHFSHSHATVHPYGLTFGTIVSRTGMRSSNELGYDINGFHDVVGSFCLLACLELYRRL